jgi:hypothetical protein
MNIVGQIRTPKILLDQTFDVMRVNGHPRAFPSRLLGDLDLLLSEWVVQITDAGLVNIFHASNRGLESRSQSF